MTPAPKTYRLEANQKPGLFLRIFRITCKVLTAQAVQKPFPF